MRISKKKRKMPFTMAENSGENKPQKQRFGDKPARTDGLDVARPSARDFQVAATVVQWLGSPVGHKHLVDLLEKQATPRLDEVIRLVSPSIGHNQNASLPCQCDVCSTARAFLTKLAK